MADHFRYSLVHEKYFTQFGERLIYNKGQYVVWSAEPSNWVYFLKEGLVQTSFSFSDGSERILGYFLPGMAFAQSGSFYAEQGFEIEFVAMKPCTVYRLANTKFLRQVKLDPAFNEDYIHLLQRNQIFLVERLRYQGEKTVRSKLIAWLLFMARYYGEITEKEVVIDIPLSQEDIANFLLVSRESVNAVFRALLASGVILHKKRLITIPDINQLKLLHSS